MDIVQGIVVVFIVGSVVEHVFGTVEAGSFNLYGMFVAMSGAIITLVVYPSGFRRYAI